jgi:hypothetical protein
MIHVFTIRQLSNDYHARTTYSVTLTQPHSHPPIIMQYYSDQAEFDTYADITLRLSLIFIDSVRCLWECILRHSSAF